MKPTLPLVLCLTLASLSPQAAVAQTFAPFEDAKAENPVMAIGQKRLSVWGLIVITRSDGAWAARYSGSSGQGRRVSSRTCPALAARLEALSPFTIEIDGLRPRRPGEPALLQDLVSDGANYYFYSAAMAVNGVASHRIEIEKANSSVLRPLMSSLYDIVRACPEAAPQ